MNNESLNENSRYRIFSVDRAIDILFLLASAPGPLSATEVSVGVGSSKSTAFAVLQTLVGRGLVESSGDGFLRRYTLGLTLARLGYTATRQVTLTDVALPRLRQLTTQTHLSSRVATYQGGRAMIVAQVEGPTAIRLNLNMGTKEALHSSGIGKAILASLSDEAVEEYAQNAELHARTDRTITSPDLLLAEVEKIRARGFSVDDQEDAEGILCIGAALQDHTGSCPGAISVTGLRVSFPGRKVIEIGAIVRTVAAEISAKLGAGSQKPKDGNNHG